MKKLYLFVIFALAVFFVMPACAQITITQGTFLGVGSTVSYYETADYVAASAGPAGANQTWTIPNQTVLGPGPMNYVSPGSTEFAASFPTATLAISNSTNAFSYMRVAGEGVYVLGFASRVDTFLTVVVYSPEGNYAPFPLSYPHAPWTTVYGWEQEPFPGFVVHFRDSSITTVDGWGTVNTQFGSTSVLRLTVHQWTITEITGLPPQVEEGISVVWVDQTGIAAVSMSPADADPNFTQAYVSFQTHGGTAADPLRGPVANNFAVGQNFPNPFNPTTTLPLELANMANVTVSIYNESGQLVSHEELTLPAGQHNLPVNGSSWASGNYFAKVTAGDFSQTTRMTLVK